MFVLVIRHQEEKVQESHQLNTLQESINQITENLKAQKDINSELESKLQSIQTTLITCQEELRNQSNISSQRQCTIDTLNNQIRSLTDDLQKSKATTVVLNKDIDALRLENTKLESNISQLTSTISNNEVDLKSLKSSLQSEKEKVSSLQATVSQLTSALDCERAQSQLIQKSSSELNGTSIENNSDVSYEINGVVTLDSKPDDSIRQEPSVDTVDKEVAVLRMEMIRTESTLAALRGDMLKMEEEFRARLLSRDEELEVRRSELAAARLSLTAAQNEVSGDFIRCLYCMS